MNATESSFWYRVRAKKLGYVFRRQYPADKYVLDFYCPELRLCIELDGPFHDLRQISDQERDEWVAFRGITTLRLSCSEVYNNMEVEVDKVLAECERLTAMNDRAFDSEG